MDETLKLAELERRYGHYFEGLEKAGIISKSGAKVMAQLLLQGEIPRGQVQEIAAVKQRRATDIIKELFEAKIVRSESAYGSLRLNITAEMSAVLFPGLA